MEIGGTSISSADHAQSAVTTALLILVMLKRRAPESMSTYELSLWIMDNKIPPRPLSIIMKTLADDGYIQRTANAGKRTGLWTITERGSKSLQQRVAATQEAEAWLLANPNYTAEEISLLISLLTHGEQSMSSLTNTCSLAISPVRTGIKRLLLRRLIEQTDHFITSYDLTVAGRAAAEALLQEVQEREAA